MNPPVIEDGGSYPSKYTVIALGGGECHLTRWVEVAGEEEVPLRKLSANR